MSQQEITATVSELQELRRMQEELEAEIASTQDKIKAHMTASGLDSLTAGAFKVTWKSVTTARVDATALRKALPEVAARFTRTATVRRFTVQSKPVQLPHSTGFTTTTGAAKSLYHSRPERKEPWIVT